MHSTIAAAAILIPIVTPVDSPLSLDSVSAGLEGGGDTVSTGDGDGDIVSLVDLTGFGGA